MRRSQWVPAGRQIDLLIVVGLVIADVSAQVSVSNGGHAASTPVRPGSLALTLVCAGLFWWRRRRPVAVLISVLAGGIVAGRAVPPGLFTEHIGVALALAAYACGSWADRRGRAVVVPAVVTLVMFIGVSSKATVGNAAAAALVVIALPWMAGQALRSRRLHLEAVEQRLVEVERERDEGAARAVLEERRHIARELHDVVAHHVSLIGVQAGAARVALDDSPESTREALKAIEKSSRDAVGEMRHLLEVLRADGTAEETDPQPGLDRLDTLVAGFSQAGLSVTTQVRGDYSLLGPILDLCCYRIVEEALTNVARHSSAKQARVDIAISPTPPCVTIRVTDPGPAVGGTSGGGRGLIGMRERLALFEGRLRCGPSETGGFTVEAQIDEMDRR